MHVVIVWLLQRERQEGAIREELFENDALPAHQGLGLGLPAAHGAPALQHPRRQPELQRLPHHAPPARSALIYTLLPELSTVPISREAAAGIEADIYAIPRPTRATINFMPFGPGPIQEYAPCDMYVSLMRNCSWGLQLAGCKSMPVVTAKSCQRVLDQCNSVLNMSPGLAGWEWEGPWEAEEWHYAPDWSVMSYPPTPSSRGAQPGGLCPSEALGAQKAQAAHLPWCAPGLFLLYASTWSALVCSQGPLQTQELCFTEVSEGKGVSNSFHSSCGALLLKILDTPETSCFRITCDAS